MIKRAEPKRDPWSGHIACPGGRMDPTDRDLEHTAIRETWEETGIDLERDGRILGTLDDMSPRTSSLPPIIIRPFVARRAAGSHDRRESRGRGSILGSDVGDTRDGAMGKGVRCRFAASASAKWMCSATATTPSGD